MTEDRVLRFIEEGDIRSHYVRIIRFCSGCNASIKEGVVQACHDCGHKAEDHGGPGCDWCRCAIAKPEPRVTERCPPCAELWAKDEAMLDEMHEAERRYKDSDAWERDIEEHER